MRCWMGMFIRQTEAVHVLFKWEQYKDNLLSVFQINKGGLAIYGGILGGVAVILIYCKVKKLSFWSLADTLIPSLVLGQAIGRWGNFMNQVLFEEGRIYRYETNLLFIYHILKNRCVHLWRRIRYDCAA